MKRILFSFGIALFAFVVFSNFSTEASTDSFDKKFVTAAQSGESGTYNFDRAHSFIGFRIKHNGLIEVPGFFRDFVGTVNYDSKEVTKSSVEFTAKVTSIDTGIAARDNHLRTKDFFEIETYPELKFKSTKVEKKGKGWMLTGDLTIKGVTKSVTFPFNITGFLPATERRGSTMGITAETKINRREFGITYGDPKAPIVGVADEVTIVLQIEANAARPAAAAATKASE
jgi:polyisoprenoid-binding protein YceI